MCLPRLSSMSLALINHTHTHTQLFRNPCSLFVTTTVNEHKKRDPVTDKNGKKISFEKFQSKIDECEERSSNHQLVLKTDKEKPCKMFYNWFNVMSHSKRHTPLAMTYALYDTETNVVVKIGWCGSYSIRAFVYLSANDTPWDKTVARRLYNGELA